VSRIDVVKRLDYGPIQLLRNPSTFRHTGLDRIDAAIALANDHIAAEIAAGIP
jgi:hypothetical protein